MAEKGTLLRIYINESNRHGKQLLYKEIIAKAHENGLAGASVFRGLCGYQAGHDIHDSSLLRLSDDMPLLIEIVDIQERIQTFIPVVSEMVDDGLITTEKVEIVKLANKH